MALTTGSRLGPYEVTALLGEGGIGQVYRATDTNLKRQVASKVLPRHRAGRALYFCDLDNQRVRRLDLRTRRTLRC